MITNRLIKTNLLALAALNLFSKCSLIFNKPEGRPHRFSNKFALPALRPKRFSPACWSAHHD